jgi:hypothetical protein
MAYDPIDGYVVLFTAGMTCSTCNSTWTYLAGRWSNLDIPGPPPRTGASVAWDSALNEMILFGGFACIPSPSQCSSAGELSDTWSFSHGRWSELAISGPSPRDQASMIFVPAAGGLILFGGESLPSPTSSFIALGDTWFFNGVWTNLSISGPPARIRAQIAVDPSAGDAILFGGIAFVKWSYPPMDSLGDTWEFNGSSWQQLQVTGPAARFWGSMAFDSADGYDLLYGGMECPGNDCSQFAPNAPYSVGDTWAFSLGLVAPIVSVDVTPTAICVFDDLSCAAHSMLATVNLSIGVGYTDVTSGVLALQQATIFVVPWGNVFLSLSTPITASCATPLNASAPCASAPSLLGTGSAASLGMEWRPNQWQNTLYVGDRWTLQFGFSVSAPPYGSVPVYACLTGSCLDNGSGTRNGSFSEIGWSMAPPGVENASSLPFANVSVDPPQVAPGGSSGPISSVPPPPPPVPIGLPGPVTIPIPVSVPSPVVSTLLIAVPSVSLSALAAGILSAGFARVVLQRRAIQIGQPIGNKVRPKRSAFEAESPTDTTVGRFD